LVGDAVQFGGEAAVADKNVMKNRTGRSWGVPPALEAET
jgi:hypothetical protein